MSSCMHLWMNTKLASRRPYRRWFYLSNFYATSSIPQAYAFSLPYLFLPVSNWIVQIQFQMFGMSKIVAERSSESKGIESSLPLQTTVSD